jgi:cytochrome c oxidase subunit 2
MSKVVYALLLVPVLASVWLMLPVPPQPATTHHLSIEASQYEFTPGRIEVAQGDEVIITLTASDVVHGLYLDGYGIAQRVEPGISQQIRFTADQPGKFRYRCLVSCGTLHPFMLGELVVTSNVPFRQAVALLLLAVTGAIAYFVRFRRDTHEPFAQTAVA